jgi:hypothetical protein
MPAQQQAVNVVRYIMTYPNHIKSFLENREEVKRLLNIHIKVAGTNRGPKTEVQVLHKSAIVLLTACWESYIETIITDSFDFLLANAETPNVFPNSVLIKATKDIRSDKDERKVWLLAADGWKKVLNDYKNNVLKKEIDYFHVPRPENIDEIFSKTIGFEKVSKQWTWKGQTNSDSIKTLNKLINLRGEIAHKIIATAKINKADVIYFLNFINNLTVCTSNAVNNYIKERVGTYPWINYYYRVRKKI